MHTHSLRLVPLLIGLKERPERPSSLRERTKLLGEGGKDTQINRKEEKNRIEKKAGQAEEKPEGGGRQVTAEQRQTAQCSYVEPNYPLPPTHAGPCF